MLSVGQTVFVVKSGFSMSRVVPCYVCYGKGEVAMTLGSGEAVVVRCDCCSHCGETRTIHEWGPDARVYERRVTGMSERNGVEIDGRQPYNDETIHIDRASADVACAEALVRVTEQAERINTENRLNSRRKQTWSVGYSLSQIRLAEASIEYHRSRVARERAALSATPTPPVEPP